MHIVILAGGGGTRLWPLSKKDFPKQFLKLGGMNSLLKQTVTRVSKLPFIQSIVISTNVAFEALVRQEVEGLDVKILVEPARRNTGPAIGFSLRYLETSCGAEPSDLVLVIPSDHLIEPEQVFLDYLIHGIAAANKGKIVTFGIRPSRPETGYGYIRIGKGVDPFTYEVEQFVEKPDLTKAQEYMENPCYYWNSGMFAFSLSTFWTESKQHYPEICESGFENLSSISIDYALMEKSKNIVVCPLPVSWSDVGSWDSLYEILEKDKNQNVKVGNIVDISTRNCLIFGGKRVISTLGLEDLVIIDTEDTLLIAKRSESQRVGEFE